MFQLTPVAPDVFLTSNLMTSASAVYTQAILTILDSLSPDQIIVLRNDVKLKLERASELQPVEIQALNAIQKLMDVSELSRTMGS